MNESINLEALYRQEQRRWLREAAPLGIWGWMIEQSVTAEPISAKL